MTELQKEIVELLNNDDSHYTCGDIAFYLKRNKMHIGNSVKSLVEKGTLDYYSPDDESNTKYYVNK